MPADEVIDLDALDALSADALYDAWKRINVKSLTPTELAAVRDALVEVAEAEPESYASPELLQAASELTSRLGDPTYAEQLLREAIEHPRIEATSRILALRRASVFAQARDDLRQVFDDLNALTEQVQALPEPLREAYTPLTRSAQGLKAVLLRSYLRRHGELPRDVPDEDRGRPPSEYLTPLLVETASGLEDPNTVLLIRQNLALALASEGRSNDALVLHDEILDALLHRQPSGGRSWRGLRALRTTAGLWIARLADALDPQRGSGYRAFLEEAASDDRLPERDRLWLTLKVARWHLGKAHNGAAYLARIAPWVDEPGPVLQECFKEDPYLLGQLLVELANAALAPDVHDASMALEYYLRYLQLPAELLDPQVERETLLVAAVLAASEPINDPCRAAALYKRFLGRFPDDPESRRVADELRRLGCRE